MHYSNQFIRPGVLEFLDMFGINVNIRFNKQVSHKTKIGGIFSVIIYFLLCVQVYLVVMNFLDSKNPTVLYQQTFTKSPERFNLTPQTFSLAFGLQDPVSMHFLDPRVYEITLWLKKIKKVYNQFTNDYNTIWDNRIVKIETCTEKHFQVENAQSYFLNLKYTQMYCISLDEKDIYIEGQFDAGQYAGLEIIVNKCNTDSKTSDGQQVTCLNEPDIYNKLNNGRLAIYYTDNAVVTRDKNNPFQPLGRQSFWVSGPEFSKTLNISFRNSYLYTDKGLIGSEIEQDRALTFSFDREQTTPKYNNILYDCYISFEKNMNSEYHRSYPKLDRALSQLGGIYNFLFAIGCLLCKPISLIEFNRKLINSLFSYEDKTENLSNNSKDKELEIKNNQFITPIKSSVAAQQITNPDILNTLTDQNLQLYSQNQNLLETRQNINIKESIVQFNQDLTKSKVIDIPPLPPKGKNSVSALKNLAKSTFRQLTQRQLQFEDVTSQSSDSKNQQIPIQIEKPKKLSLSANTLKQRRPSITQQQYQKKRDEQLKKDAKDLDSIFVQTFNSIRFKSWEYFASYFKIFSCWRTKKQEIIKEGVEKLYNHIDIFYIINKLLEVEKLKHLLLNENQLQLFEFIPKPVLYSEDKMNTSQDSKNKLGILYEDKRSILEKTLEAQKSFNLICSSSHKMTRKDKRLIELLHPKFKNLVEDCIDSEPEMVEEDDSTIFSKNQVRKTVCNRPLSKTEEIINEMRIQ